MIINLNQVNFKDYGTISPERAVPPEILATEEPYNTIFARQGPVCVYRAAADTLLMCQSGMTVLSVSSDLESFQHYYLDKPVSIREGIYFCISPFRKQETSVQYSASEAPAPENRTLDPGDLQLHGNFRIGSLYTFFYHEKEQGFFFPGESHPMLELTYVDRGSMHSVVDGNHQLLQQGELTLYGPNQWHMQYADIGIAPRYVTISFDMEGGDLSALYGRNITAPQNAVTLLQQMLREQENTDNYTVDVMIGQLTLLLLTILRMDGTPSCKLKASNSLHSDNEIIQHAQQYISKHIRDRLSVPIVARNVDVSPSYLTALFHKNIQISPGEYIRRLKLQESKQMIRENSMNFSEIAAALQYSTVHHFSRQFKDKFGITPTEYAKSVR